jgi:TfoX/Sxy family transcriptional regulator of competence genes
VGQVEDEIRVDAEDALAAIDGLETRRVFSGWGFYRHGLLFAAAWEGEFRFRTRQDGRWIYEIVDRDLLDHPDELVAAARKILGRLEREPAARKPRSRAAQRGRHDAAGQQQRRAPGGAEERR